MLSVSASSSPTACARCRQCSIHLNPIHLEVAAATFASGTRAADGTFSYTRDPGTPINRLMDDELESLHVDASAELGRLGLDEHLSSQRSNGLRAMVQRIRQIASSAEAAA